jgi:hypothetical protein
MIRPSVSPTASHRFSFLRSERRVKTVEDFDRFLEVDAMLLNIQTALVVIPFEILMFHGLTLLLCFRRRAVSRLMVMKSLLGKC